jgi:large subunit ribosomal protein L5
MAAMVRLREHYETVVKAALNEEFGYKNPLQVPRLEKIVVNMGVGESVLDSKVIDGAADELTLIAGQKPIIIKARKSVATFKLREGMRIGCKVTLRRDRMYEFVDRLTDRVSGNRLRQGRRDTRHGHCRRDQRPNR